MQKTYTERYKKAIAAIGKPENLRETETYFMVRWPLLCITVNQSYSEPVEIRVEVTWSAIGAVAPAQAQKFIARLAKVTKLAARIEGDIKKRGRFKL